MTTITAPCPDWCTDHVDEGPMHQRVDVLAFDRGRRVDRVDRIELRTSVIIRPGSPGPDETVLSLELYKAAMPDAAWPSYRKPHDFDMSLTADEAETLGRRLVEAAERARAARA